MSYRWTIPDQTLVRLQIALDFGPEEVCAAVLRRIDRTNPAALRWRITRIQVTHRLPAEQIPLRTLRDDLATPIFRHWEPLLG